MKFRCEPVVYFVKNKLIHLLIGKFIDKGFLTGTVKDIWRFLTALRKAFTLGAGDSENRVICFLGCAITIEANRSVIFQYEEYMDRVKEILVCKETTRHLYLFADDRAQIECRSLASVLPFLGQNFSSRSCFVALRMQQKL